ncbi:MAG: flippase [Cyanobacteria bacterium SBLK]|nr:flippase [Cyanobacteria bacterium SBLK]
MDASSTPTTDKNIDLVTLGRNSIFALGLLISGTALTYLIQVLFARWMGKTEYGMYEYAMTFALLLAIPTSLGFPNAVVRLVNEYRVKREWSLLRGLLATSWLLTIGMGLGICLAGTAIVICLDRDYLLPYIAILSVGIWLIPLQALVQLQEDMARGFDSISLAYIPTKIFWPLLLLAGGFLLWRDRSSLTGISAISIALGTLLAIVSLQAGLLWFKFNRTIPPETSVYIPWTWLKVALPLLLYRGFREMLAQTDILMLGSLIDAASVGLYSAAAKTSLWINIILKAFVFVVAPTFTILHLQGDRLAFQNLVSRVTFWMFAVSFLVGTIFIFFSQSLLGLFGSEFPSVSPTLKVLTLGQLFDAACGCVGNILAMTGYQNHLMKVSGYTALINLGLNAILIPFWGLLGASFSTTLSLIIWNIWLTIVVIRNLQINPTIFPDWILFFDKSHSSI